MRSSLLIDHKNYRTVRQCKCVRLSERAVSVLSRSQSNTSPVQFSSLPSVATLW